MLKKFLSTVAIALMCAGIAHGQLIVDFDLGTVAPGNTNVVGDTTTFGSEVDYFGDVNSALNWGNEIVYQFTVTGDLNELNIMSNALTGDPDFFLLDSVDVEDDGTGKLFSVGVFGFYFLDLGPPELGVPVVVPAGTYYLCAATYNGPDPPNMDQATFDIDLIVAEVEPPEPPTDAIDLGVIADVDEEFTIDTLGSLFDTELGLYDSAGNLLVLNDDEPGGSLQSELTIDGLDAGTYYLALGEFNSIYLFGFEVTTDGALGGDYTLNYNGNTMPGTLTGGTIQWFVFQVGSAGPVIVTPTSITTTRGQFVEGDIAEISDSDNSDYRVQRSSIDTLSRTEFTIEATSPTATPTSLEVTLEGAVFARSNVVQTISLFNFTTGVFDDVDSQNSNRSPQPDLTVTVAATGTLSDYVEPGTNLLRAKVLYESDNRRQRFTSNSDQFIWTIE